MAAAMRVNFSAQHCTCPAANRTQRPSPRQVAAWASTPARADAAASTSSPSQTTVKALREWSVVNAAIRDGLQMVLLRKGGIDEKGFDIQARELVLFPSYFHADPSLLKPGMAERYQQEMGLDPKSAPELRLDTYARITGAWATKDPEVVAAVEALHVGSSEFLEKRTKWRRGQALTILELQAWRLKEPLVVTPKPEHFGCFSWVDLEGQTVNLEGATPCIPNFEQRQAELRARLDQLKDTQQLQL